MTNFFRNFPGRILETFDDARRNGMLARYENWGRSVALDRSTAAVDSFVANVSGGFFPSDRMLLISAVVAEAEGDGVILFEPHEQLEEIGQEPTEPRFARRLPDVTIFVEGFGHWSEPEIRDRVDWRATARWGAGVFLLVFLSSSFLRS
jgi:hypothetical protein